MLSIKTYIISVGYEKNGKVYAAYDSAHIKPSLAELRKQELEKKLAELGITNYDIDVVAAFIDGDSYKAGI